MRRLIAIAGLVFVLLVGATIYKKWPSPPPNSSIDQGPGGNQQAVMSVPPFVTKEPERYQATRSITFTESTTNAATVDSRISSILIARDGNQRREEYEEGAGGRIIYLENPAGRFVLLPRAKLYADLAASAGGIRSGDQETEVNGDSPDLLLHESAIDSRYEKLGGELIGGRATTKYRVTNSEANATVSSETFIWIDEALGMPIKSESTHVDSDRSTKVLMELKDIRSDVASKLFVLPADYRKVAVSLIFGMIRQATSERQPAREQSPGPPK